MSGTEPMFGIPFLTDLDPAADIALVHEAQARRVAEVMQGRVVHPDVATLQDEIAARGQGDLDLGARIDALGATPWTGLGFQNSASNLGSPYRVGQYRKVGDEVQLRGSINAPSNTNPFATLPVGFRPTAIEILTSATDGGTNNVYAHPDGRLVRAWGTTTTWLSLAGMRFSLL